MTERKKHQGVLNIIRFNWPFYFWGLFAVLGLYITALFLQPLVTIIPFVILIMMMISLLVSWYIYDLSGIYKIKWLDELKGKVLIINAGFDEISPLIRKKFSQVHLTVADFYDEKLMTEPSIKRARKIYPLEKEAKKVLIGNLKVVENYDRVLLFFAAHEIRKESDRIIFFKELNRIISDKGEIYIIEHLRDWKNFLAYTIGFLHFHSKNTWKRAFLKGDFSLKEEIKLTPFVSLFKIKKNGNSS